MIRRSNPPTRPALCPSLKSGHAAHFETVRDGLIRCEVLFIGKPKGGESPVRLRVLKHKSCERSGYNPGDIIDTVGRHAIPLAAVEQRDYSTVIMPYVIEHDEEIPAEN